MLKTRLKKHILWLHLPFIYKIYRLLYHYKKHNIITKIQYGALKGHSTILQIIRLVELLWKYLISTDFDENKTISKHKIYLFFSDISKAFDSFSRVNFLNLLIKDNVQGRLLNIIGCYYGHRYQKTIYNHTSSKLRRTFDGTPQGTSLSLTCYIINMNSIIRALIDLDNNALFIDDLVGFLFGDDWTEATDVLLRQFNNMFNWSINVQQKFNASKFHVLGMVPPNVIDGDKIYHRKNTEQQKSRIKFNNETIKLTRSEKFLGVIIDNKLSFIPHIKNTIVRIEGSLWRLYNHTHLYHGLDSFNLYIIFMSYIYPLFSYGVPIWIWRIFDVINLYQNPNKRKTKF